MAMQKCSNCSAPLSLGEVDSIQPCNYCGTENRMLDPSKQGMNITINSNFSGLLIPVVVFLPSLCRRNQPGDFHDDKRSS